jgi:methylated-DNA-[protein]-cysteine S-methyltransferase
MNFMKSSQDKEKEYLFKTMKSPVGELKLVASNKGLVAILWEDDKPRRVQAREYVKKNDHPILLKTEKELKEYFAKKRKKFTVKTDFIGTDFQKKVWAALLTIPFAETRSYGDIAKQVGSPQAVRAVGGAIGKNPIAILAPCHRVIGTNGKLTGFAGGLNNKEILLGLESKK